MMTYTSKGARLLQRVAAESAARGNLVIPPAPSPDFFADWIADDAAEHDEMTERKMDDDENGTTQGACPKPGCPGQLLLGYGLAMDGILGAYTYCGYCHRIDQKWPDREMDEGSK